MARSPSSKTTTNHSEIRKWVEKNGGSPARVKTTGRGKNDPGILRIDYPGFSGQDTLVKIDWDEWFQAFDENGLAFVYQPSTRFSKLVARTAVRSSGRTTKRSARRTAGRSATAGRRTGAKKSTARRGTTAKKRASTRSTRPAKRTTKRSTKRSSARSRA
jgi:hypothetical protein